MPGKCTSIFLSRQWFFAGFLSPDTGFLAPIERKDPKNSQGDYGLGPLASKLEPAADLRILPNLGVSVHSVFSGFGFGFLKQRPLSFNWGVECRVQVLGSAKEAEGHGTWEGHLNVDPKFINLGLLIGGFPWVQCKIWPLLEGDTPLFSFLRI